MTDPETAPASAEPLAARVVVVDYDLAWPAWFEAQADRIRAAIGGAALAIEHVGSTAVPGLPAKPVIDINLAVADAADEAAYAPALEAAGYRLIIRQPEWNEHRMFKGRDPEVNLHVYAVGCPELDRVRLFRDWLRASAEDRVLYAQTKRALAARDWSHVQDYADAKTEVVAQIMTRAQTWAGTR
jgi:GrpB-like predicted nucleotidyltransferase (UPF0157 family)